MKRNSFSLLLMALISFSIYSQSCPADATQPASGGANTPANTNEVALKSADAGQANNSAVSKNTPTSKAPLSKKVFSVTTAFFIGTPVCIVRRSKYEEWYGVHGMIGNSDSKCKKVLAGAFWLPWAIITGTLEAPFDATTNGIRYPAFSKDQLSQGKLVQNN